MPVLISMLRGVNVGGHNRIKMDALRALYESLKLGSPRTYVQSGNVIFRTREKNSAAALAQKIQNAIERKFGFRPEVILRTTEEMRNAIAATPFTGRNLEPGKTVITFLADDAGPDAYDKLLTLRDFPEELHLLGRELHIYFPDGMGRSKLPWAKIERLLGTPGTARNWNSVTKMLAMAEEMEAEK